MKLVIPDSHEQYAKFKKVIEDWDAKVDEIYFLGDWTDTFEGLTPNTHRMAEYMRDLLMWPKFTALWGNHDLHYAYSRVRGVHCSGYDDRKRDIFEKTLTREHWDKVKTHAWVDGWLLSHAGVHKHFAHAVRGLAPDYIDERCAIAMQRLKSGMIDEWLGAGFDRGGPQAVGGIIWLDWRSFHPITDLNQLVGHTNGREVRYNHTIRQSNTSPKKGKGKYLSRNVCIDTHLRHIALIDKGEVEIIPL